MARRKAKYNPLAFDRGEDWTPPYLEEQKKAAEAEARPQEVAPPAPRPAPVAPVAQPEQGGYWSDRVNDLSSIVDQLSAAGNLIGAGWQSIGANAEGAELRRAASLSPDQIGAAEAKARQLTELASRAPEGASLGLINQANAIYDQINSTRQIQADPQGAAIAMRANQQYRDLIAQQQQKATQVLDKGDPSHILKITAGLVGDPTQIGPIAGGFIGGAIGGAATAEAGGVGAPVGAHVGGAIGSLPMLKVQYDTALNHAMDKGLPFADADKFAKWMAGSAFGMQAATGGLAARFGGAAKKPVVDALFNQWAKQTGKAGLIGAGGMAGTVGVQDIGNMVIAAHSDGKLGQVASEEVPKTAVELFNQMYDASLGGFIAGAGIGGAHNTFEAFREAGAQVARINRAQDRNTRKEIPTEQPSLFPEDIHPTVPEGGTDSAPIRVTTEQDVARLNELNREIANLQERVDTGKAKTPQMQRLLSLKAARTRLVGLPKPRAVGTDVVEEGLNLNYPVQPLSPEFTGLEQGTRAVPPVPEEAIPANVVDQSISSGGVQNVKRTAVGAVPVNKTPSAKPAKAGAPVTSGRTAAEDIAALRAGLKQEGGPETDTTPEDIYNRLREGKGTKTTAIMSHLLDKDNVQIVAHENEIPAGAEKVGAAGFYDGRRTYIVANKIPKANMNGELLNVAAHELHHAANRSGKITMRGFVGEQEIDKLNDKIRVAAKAGDKDAQWAMSMAAKAERSNPGSAREEVVPYLINRVRAKRQQSSAIRGITGDLVASIRNKVGMEVGLKDVAYLSDRLLEQAAQSPERLADTQSGRGQAMIYDRTATGYDEEAKVGHTYTSADTLRKFVKSDAEARVKDDAIPNLKTFKDVALVQVLDHPELYKQKPSLKEYTVQLADFESPTQFGAADPATKTLYVSRNFADSTEFAGTTLREALLHEIQHLVQGEHPLRKQDFFNREAAATNEDKRIMAGVRHADKVATEAAVKFVEGAKDILDQIPDKEIRDRITKQIMSSETSMDKKAQLLEHAAKTLNLKLGEGPAKQLAKYKAAAETFNKLAPEARVVEERLHQKYEENITEAEAFFTQDNADVPESRLPINPERNFRQKKIDVPTTNRMNEKGEKLAAGEKPAGLAMNLERLKKNLEEEVSESEPSFRAVKSILAKTFTPTQGRGDALNEILHGAGGKQSALAAEAEVRTTRVWDAIHSSAKKDGNTEASVIADLDAAVARANEEPNKAVRTSIIAALDRKHPGLGRAMNELRTFKRNLTEEIIEQRIRDDKPLTEKETATFKKMLENDERYTTRAYLATLGGKVSKNYSRALMREFHNDPTSESGRKVQEAIDFLVEKQLTVPDRETLEQMDTASLKRMYQTWMNKTPKVKGEKAKAKMVDELSNMPEKTQEEIQAKALEVVRSLLGLTENANAIATYLRGGKQNRTVLESRKDVPPEVRNLLGEITHPVVREMISVMRMSALIHKTQSLTDIYETMKGKEWADESSDQFPVHMSSEAYGPMDGKFVSHRLADMLKDSTIYRTTIEQDLKAAMLDPELITGKIAGPILKTFRGISTAQKTAGLILTPFAMMANLAGSWTMALANGVGDVRVWGKSMHDTALTLKAAVSHRQSDAHMDIAKELQLAKVLDSATVGQWQSAMHKDMLDQITRLDPTQKNFRGEVKRIIQETYAKYPKKGLDYTRSAYAFMDVWAKVASYYDRKNYLTDFYKAEGIPKTEEQIIREAGYEASKTNISYDMAIPIFRLLERNFAPVFMFATFTSECFRAHAQSYAQVFRDLSRAQNATTAEGRRMAQKAAMKRLAGTLVTEVGLNALFSQLLNSESDEDKRKRQLDAPWEKNDVLIPVGIDKDGHEHMLGMSRFDPIGPYNELERALVNAKTPEEQIAAAKEGVTQFFIQSKSAAAFTHLVGDIVAHSVGPAEWDKRRKQNTMLEREWPQVYDKLSNGLSKGDVGENLAEVIDTLTPGILRPLLDPHLNDVVQVRPKDQAWIAPTMKYLGGKTYIRDPDKAMTFRTIDYTKGMKQLKKERDEFLEKQKDLNPDAILSKLKDLRDKEKLLQTDLSKAYDGYLAFDKTPAQADRILKDARLTSIGRANLHSGKNRSELTDAKTLVEWYKKSIKAAEPEDRKDVKARYELLKRLYAEENN